MRFSYKAWPFSWDQPRAGRWAQGTGRSLDIQPGGRQNGMGAAASHCDDPPRTWWNQAALGFVGRSAVELTYASWCRPWPRLTYNFGTYVQPIEGWGALGIGLVFLSYGRSEGADGGGNSTGFFNSNEVSPAIYYGTQVLPDFAVGASLKYIRIQLAPSDRQGVGQTFGLDLGALYAFPRRASIRLNVQNLGPASPSSRGQVGSLGRNVKVGAAWDRCIPRPTRCCWSRTSTSPS